MYLSEITQSIRGFELPAAYGVKKSGFLTQMERTRASAFLNNEQSGDRTEAVYHQLSDRSKDVLAKLKESGTAEMVLGSRSLNQWSGQPLDMLDTWSFLLTKWGRQLAAEHNPDGTPKYRDLTPISNQASACEKLKELINSLTEFA